ncbi:MAG TPA: glycosyltransferase family 4 protein [Fibrobacteria bacterium]|nr:glycosyltransferase family 4 protein [Fibrobacteria bacterium]
MEVVFVDPEPPDAAGGGIRTYLRLAMRLCREAGHAARVYTHNPSEYAGESAYPIGRKPWLRKPFRGLAYRLLYQENVLWEHAYWLNAELEAGDAPDRVYEFCDFLGYGFFALRNRTLRARILLRVHTPAFLVASGPAGAPMTRFAAARFAAARFAARLGAWRERDCLKRARRLTVPSAEFIREKLPWLTGWEHVPNPLPPDMTSGPDGLDPAVPIPALPPAAGARMPAASETPELPRDPGSGWSAAPVDPAETAERNAPRPTRIDPVRFLFLGRVEERKGVLVLVRAFVRLAAERPYASLTLVGSAAPGPYAAAVRYLIESQPASIRPRLAWEPPCSPEARPALFRRFTALVAPSLWENSPYVYFEGMAAGLPCIGSATGEMKAVAAATGALSPAPGDEESWLDALRAHCSGAGRDALPAQAAYLRERRAAIPGLLLDAWRRASGAA